MSKSQAYEMKVGCEFCLSPEERCRWIPSPEGAGLICTDPSGECSVENDASGGLLEKRPILLSSLIAKRAREPSAAEAEETNDRATQGWTELNMKRLEPAAAAALPATLRNDVEDIAAAILSVS